MLPTLLIEKRSKKFCDGDLFATIGQYCQLFN